MIYYYKLKNEEISAAKELASAISDYCKNNNTKGYKKSPKKSNKEITFEGVCGEIAMNSLLLALEMIDKKEWINNLQLIKSIKNISAVNGEDEGDLVYKKLNIDVKTSVYENAHLWITSSKTARGKFSNKIDRYVLLTGGEKTAFTYIFKGFITADQFQENYPFNKGKWHQSLLNSDIRSL